MLDCFLTLILIHYLKFYWKSYSMNGPPKICDIFSHIVHLLVLLNSGLWLRDAVVSAAVAAVAGATVTVAIMLWEMTSSLLLLWELPTVEVSPSSLPLPLLLVWT